MKFMPKYKFIILFFLTSLSAHADISGDWYGMGQWAFDGSGVGCYMKLAFEQKENTIIRRGGYFDCNLVGMETYPMSWPWDGKNLYYEQDIVGSYDGFKFELKEDYSENVYVMTYIALDGDDMTYKELWRQKDSGNIIYEIDGHLSKK